MTECRQIQKDILAEYYSYEDSHRQKSYYSPACVPGQTARQTNTVQDRLSLFNILPTYKLLLFKIDFYCSRFYRQINLSSLHLTQVTFEDLPLFILSINRQTPKTEDRSSSKVQIYRSKFTGPKNSFKFQVQILGPKQRSNSKVQALERLYSFPFPSPKDFCTLLSFCNLVALPFQTDNLVTLYRFYFVIL